MGLAMVRRVVSRSQEMEQSRATVRMILRLAKA
jgi:hypothetical protein